MARIFLAMMVFVFVGSALKIRLGIGFGACCISSISCDITSDTMSSSVQFCLIAV